MLIDSIDTNQKVFIVAEIGNNHEGNYSLAQEMIGLAAEAGVDAVKFQTYIPEYFVSNSDTAKLDRLRRFQLSFEQFSNLSKQATKEGLIFFSTPFDLESALFLNTIQPIFKISSGDNNFFPLIELVASFEKPTIISTGWANSELIKSIYEFWCERGAEENLALLHCISNYPTLADQANLFAIQHMKQHFPKLTIGYSDHTLGIKAATLAVACGAKIIEKHFTHDKNHSDFHDHKISADSKEMKILVESIREASIYLGTGEKNFQVPETNEKTKIRRSIAAALDLNQGIVLTESNITWVRPGNGIPPGNESKIIGCKIKRHIKQGELIQPEDLV